MSNQFLKLRRSAVPGKIPETSSLDYGEIALNTYDGRAFMKKSGSSGEQIVIIGDVSGSFSGSFTGSFFGTSSWAYNAVTASTADDFFIRGNVTASNALVQGTITAQTLVVQTISSSIIYSSGSNIFGDELTDRQQFTGSVTMTGSLTVSGPSTFNGLVTANNITGSIFGTGSLSGSFTGSHTGSFFGAFLGTGSLSGSFTGSSTGSFFGYGSLTGSFLGSHFGTASLSGSFTGSHTGSFFGQAVLTGSFNGVLSGSFSGSVDNLRGQDKFIPVFVGTNLLTSSVMYQSGSSIAINETNFTTNDPEALYVFQTHPTSINVISGKGNLNNYLQLNIQNTNQGIGASSDIVATANNGNETGNYIDMGINSENFGTNFIGGPNDAYLYNTGSNLHIGNISPNGAHIGFFVGGTDTDVYKKFQLNPLAPHEMSGSLNITGSLIVTRGITGSFTGSLTGSLFGTASWAISASHAVNAYTASHTLTASYVNPLTQSVFITGSLTVSGSTSIVGSTGTTVFSTNADTIVFSGSMFMTGSISHTGSISSFGGFTGSLLGTSSWALSASHAASYTLTSSFHNFTQSYYVDSASFSTRITANSASIASLSSSFLTDSASFSSRITTNSASIALLSSSFLTDSASFSTRITTNSASIALLSSSFLTDSASFSSRITTNSASIALLSSSFLTDSASFSTRITNNSASIALLSSSFLTDSASFSTRITTNSASIALLSSSFLADSASFSTRITTNSASIALLSSSFLTDSASFSTRITANSASISFLSSSFLTTSASFVNVSASYAQLSSSFRTGSYSGSFSGSFLGTGSYSINALTASHALTASSADEFLVRGNITASNAVVQGTITAQTLIVQTITSSVEFVTGSTKFGSQLTDTHQFTGSVTITGSLSLNNDPVVTQTPYNNFSQSIQLRATNLESTASVLTAASASFSTRVTTLENASASFAQQSGSNSIRLTNLESTASILTLASASLAVDSGSNSTRFTKLESTASVLTSASASLALDSGSNSIRLTNLESTASVLTIASASFSASIAALSGSYLIDSASFSTRITANSESISILSSSFLTNSSSFSTRITNNSASISALSSSYLIDSASFSTRITANSASIAFLSSSFLTTSASFENVSASYSQLSSSFRTGSYTGSFTGSFLGTGSNAVSASYAFNADFLDGKDSSVFATTGSNVFVGNQTVTGSLFTTGSNTLVGTSILSGSVNISGSTTVDGTAVFRNSSTTITGSLLVSGSTTQVGNNTLFGNTTLSGSIIISGSTGPGATTASVQIYGDIEQKGYIKLLPVTTNINTSISASYIYVSGSTNDLYFSQNGSGYNNVTRLRWIEGNLYTGLLNGGLITTQSSTVYQVSSGSGIIVNLNASFNDNPYPTVSYLNWSNLSASIAPLSASYDQSFVAVDDTGNIFAQGTPYSDGQYNTTIPIGVVIHQNRSTINGTQTFASLGYGWKQRSSDFIRAFGPLKLSGLTMAVSGSTTGSLIITSGTAWSDGRNYSIDPNNPSYITDSGTTTSKIFRYRQSGSNWVYDTNAGAGYLTIDPSQYSNNGILTSVGAGNWSIQRVFWFPNSVTKAIYVYYGNAIYSTEADAIANLNIESFVEAPNTAAQAVYIGAIVISGNGVFTNTNTYKILPGGLFRNIGGSGGGGSVVTQTLSGLSDVAISGPTDHQPFAYDTTAGKWTNQSTISASLAGNASTATTASYAVTASSATFAALALTASVAPSYTLTSSFTSFTQSYYTDSASFSTRITENSASIATLSSSFLLASASFDNRINSLTESVFTHVVTNNGSSNYIIDGIAKPKLSFVPGATYRFNTSGVVGSHPFRFSTSPNGPTEYTTGVTIGANYTQIEVNYDTPTTLYYYCTIHSGMGNEINTLRVDALVTTSSFNSFTASYYTDSSSFSTRITDNSASIATLSSSFLIVSSSYSELSSSFRTGSYTGSFTGSFLGTGSQAISASYALTASSAIFAASALTASYFVTQSVTNATSASYAQTASSADDFTVRGNLTGSNAVFSGTITAQTLNVQTITSSVEYITGSTQFGSLLTNTHQFTGSVTITGSLSVNNNPVITQNQTSSMSVLSSSYALTASSAIFAASALTASYFVTESVTSASYALTASSAVFAKSALTASYFVTESVTSASYALTASSAIFAASALTASYFVTQSVSTASYALNAVSSSYALSASYAANVPATASYALQALSSSYALTASYALNAGAGGISAIYIADEGNIQGTASYFDFVGAGVTTTVSNGTASINIPGGSGGGGIVGQNAVLTQSVAAMTWSFTHNLGTQYPVFTIFDANDDVIIPQRIYAASTTNAFIYFSSARTGYAVAALGGGIVSSSYALTATSASYALTASSAVFATQALTASYFVTQSVTNATSASYAATASSADNFLVRNNVTASNALITGTITAQTLVVQTVTSSIVYSSGSNIFGNDLTNTQQLTGSVTVTGSLSVNGSPVILTNQTSSMTVLSSSYALTASYFVTQSVTSASYALTASSAIFAASALTASYFVTQSVSSSTTASYAFVAASGTGSFTGSFIGVHSGSFSGSYTGSLLGTASYASQALSSSFALTASYALNAGAGGISAVTIADEGVVQGSASYFDFTGAGVTATISAGTASINITGTGGGGGTAGLTTTFTQSVAADPWTFIHNLNTKTPLVQVYDTTFNQITPQYISASTANTVIIGFGGATAGYAVASTGGTLVVTGSNVILDQSVAATTWSFNHNLNTQYPIFQVFNTSDEVIIPQKIVASSTTGSLIYFPTAIAGKAVASVGGLSGSITASYAETASFALTASYSLTGTGFPYSGSAVITGSFLVSQSFVDFSKATYVSGSFTGSLFGTASYATFALSASNAPGFTTNFSQSSAAATWSFVHNLNTRNPIVQVYDTSYKQIIPNDIVAIDLATVEVRFDYAQAGYAVASNGGGLYVTGSTSRIVQSVAATTWSFQHNLNTKYPAFEVYDSSDNVIIPAGIKVLTTDSAEIYFATATSGTAIANFSGINGLQDNAVTASFALSSSNFSVSNTIRLNGTLTDTATVLSSVVGSNNLFTQATGSFTSGFFKYTVANGTDARSGEVTAVWNGANVEFMDNSTSDIGSTTPVTASVVLVSGDVQFNMQTNTSGWRIKSIATFI